MARRDQLENTVSEFIAAIRNPQSARTAYRFMAFLLVADELPPAGRIFLSDILMMIAEGADPTKAMLPKGSALKDRGPGILEQVEKAVKKRGAGHGEMGDIYEAVGRRQQKQISSGRVQNLASSTRHRREEVLAPYKEAVIAELKKTRADIKATGHGRALVDLYAHVSIRLKLPRALIELIDKG